MDELIERSLRGQTSAEDVASLAAWRRESIDNEQHYQRTVRLLVSLRSGAASTPPAPTVDEILRRSREPRAPRPPYTSKLRRRLLAPAVVVAAALAVAAITLGLERFWPAEIESVAAVPGDVGYSTGTSEMATVQLSDGSVVRLAPNTKLRFAQTRESREATLDGRAFFSVSHIPGRPFRVRTRFGEATVLGTRFELSTAAKELTLVVVSGRVALSSSEKAVEVLAGQQSAVRNGAVLAPEPVPDAETMEQRVGKFLAFQDTPMREVAREIGETYGVRVVVADSAIARRTVSGTFTDRDAKHVLEAVCLAVNALCEWRRGELVVSNR